jgi:hypothetical protein
VRNLTSNRQIELAKDLINSNQVFKSDFITFLINKIGVLRFEELSLSLNELLIQFIHDKISLNKQYQRFAKLDYTELETILQGVPFPSIKELVIQLRDNHIEFRGFNVLDFFGLLEFHAKQKLKEQEGQVTLNKKSVQDKALIQTLNLIKKDMNGLLGVSNLAKREKIKKPKHNPQSVWTVKK